MNKDEQPEERGREQFNVLIPVSLGDRLRSYKAASGESFTAIAIEALKAWLRRNGA